VVSEVTPPPPPFRVIVPATVKIDPEVVNLRSRGVSSAFVELPEPYAPADVDVSTVVCQGAPAVNALVVAKKLIVKCDVQQLEDVRLGQRVELWVGGQLSDGSVFFGSHFVRVIR